MKFPHPMETLAGCCWLPRLVAKCRLAEDGALPFSYRIALGSPIGVDGHFCRHFRISPGQVRKAVRLHEDDGDLAVWFLGLAKVDEDAIAAWNKLAPRLGSRGAPGYLTRQLVKTVLYPQSLTTPVASVFEAIIQDEGLPASPGNAVVPPERN